MPRQLAARKCLARRRRHRLEHSPQALSRVVQVGSRSSFRNPKCLSNFGMCKPFYIVQNQHRPHSVRQLRERLCQTAPQLVSFSRITKRACERLVQFVSRSHLSSPCEVQCRVRNDPIEPRSERLVQIEAVKRLISSHERLLHSVFSIFVYCDNRSRDRVSTL